MGLQLEKYDKMKLPLKVVKDILGEDSINEKFTKKDFDRNEDENEHTKNSYELGLKCLVILAKKVE